MGLNDEEQFHPFAMDFVGMGKGKSIGAKEKQGKFCSGILGQRIQLPFFFIEYE